VGRRAALAVISAVLCVAPGVASAQEATSALVVDGDQHMLFRVDLATGDREIVSANDGPGSGPPLVRPTDVAVEADGSILVTNLRDGAILRIDPSSGDRELVSSNASPPGGPAFADLRGIALEANGSIIVSSGPDWRQGSILRVNPATGVRQLVSATGNPAGGPDLTNPRDVEIAPDGTIIYVSPLDESREDGTVVAVDPVTGARTVISSSLDLEDPDFGDPTGLALESNGVVLVTDFVGQEGTGPNPFLSFIGVLRVSRATGARSLLAGSQKPGDFVAPMDVAVASGGRALVAEYGGWREGKVLSVEQATGAVALVSGSARGSGPPIVLPTGIALEPPRDDDSTAPGPSPGRCFGKKVTIRAVPGRKKIKGTDGNDVIAGTKGPDVINGGKGNDVICAFGGSDKVKGGPGKDKIKGGGGGNDRVFGGAGNDTLIGGKKRDKLWGNGGNDTLLGKSRNDLLVGGPGDDRLNGGPGEDRCIGGPGKNRLKGCE